jgi:hypothetical protein
MSGPQSNDNDQAGLDEHIAQVQERMQMQVIPVAVTAEERAAFAREQEARQRRGRTDMVKKAVRERLAKRNPAS